MNMCIQATLDETVMLPMGMLLSFYFPFVLHTVMLYRISSVYN